MSKKFRFGVMATDAPSAEQWTKLARRAESLGYSVLTMPDHFDDKFAPVPALAAAAAVTQTLRLGSAVFCNDFKNPVMLAKEVATLDVLSGGRFEFGIGAGWMKFDYEAAGIAYDEPKVRIDRFEEALQIIKGLFASGPVNFSGVHYKVKDLEGTPKPVQRPHPPIYIGGGGRRMLSVAARQADIVGINADLRRGVMDAKVLETNDMASAQQKVGWVREAAGARFDDLELTMGCFVGVVTDNPGAAASQAAPLFGTSAEAILRSPHSLIGTVDQIVDEIQRRRDLMGISYITFRAEVMESLAPVVERLTGK